MQDHTSEEIERRARILFRTESATAAPPFGIGLLFEGGREDFLSSWDSLAEEEKEKYRQRARVGGEGSQLSRADELAPVFHDGADGGIAA
ncbi:hypothetical protein [Calidifontibacter indicus]|uniref:hypothetical protein n=1 Tax=Calidifontibacter indicus TaxID=419650 RepID=UPI003D726A5F